MQEEECVGTVCTVLSTPNVPAPDWRERWVAGLRLGPVIPPPGLSWLLLANTVTHNHQAVHVFHLFSRPVCKLVLSCTTLAEKTVACVLSSLKTLESKYLLLVNFLSSRCALVQQAARASAVLSTSDVHLHFTLALLCCP